MSHTLIRLIFSVSAHLDELRKSYFGQINQILSNLWPKTLSRFIEKLNNLGVGLRKVFCVTIQMPYSFSKRFVMIGKHVRNNEHFIFCQYLYYLWSYYRKRQRKRVLAKIRENVKIAYFSYYLSPRTMQISYFDIPLQVLRYEKPNGKHFKDLMMSCNRVIS